MADWKNRRYLFEYACDEDKCLREMTLERFASNSLPHLAVLCDPKYPQISPWLSVGNNTIFTVWGESEDMLGNPVWVKQDIEEVFQLCMRYADERKSVSSGDKAKLKEVE